MEVLLTSLDPAKLGIDITSLHARCNDTLANIWMCDTGARMHVTWSNRGMKDMQDTKMYSLRHAGAAMESTVVIDIPGVFVTKGGKMGLPTILKDCSFNGGHNFNLLSMSKLLHMWGWKITCGDKSLIWIENRKGGVIFFDIVVPTEKAAIYSCKFMCMTEIAASSTKSGVRLNINMVHCLLGHWNEDSMQKTAREFGWVLAWGMLKPCKHCTKSKAKQRNVRKELVA